MMTKEQVEKSLSNFDEWWNEYEDEHEDNSLHMSSYHMALSVWMAAVDSVFRD